MQIDWLQILIQAGALGLLAFLLERLSKSAKVALDLFASQLGTWQQAMISSASAIQSQSELLRNIAKDLEDSRQASESQVQCLDELCQAIKETEASMRLASAGHEARAEDRHGQIMAILAMCPICRGQHTMEGSEISADQTKP